MRLLKWDKTIWGFIPLFALYRGKAGGLCPDFYGGATVVAIRMGRGDKAGANHAFMTAFSIPMLMGTCLSVFLRCADNPYFQQRNRIGADRISSFAAVCPVSYSDGAKSHLYSMLFLYKENGGGKYHCHQPRHHSKSDDDFWSRNHLDCAFCRRA